jgi:sortase A
MNTGTLGRRAEWLLYNAGLLLVAIAGMSLLRYVVFQSRGAADPGLPVHLAARLEIPRLGMSLLVVDGEEKAGLSVGAFHVSGTAPIGGVGNAVIAGHRDTAFFPLRNLKPGDVITLTTPERYFYTVKWIRIVQPDDVSVLADGSDSILTLVTCYPFHFIGSAPQRFVVRAQLTS